LAPEMLESQPKDPYYSLQFNKTLNYNISSVDRLMMITLNKSQNISHSWHHQLKTQHFKVFLNS